MIKKKTIYIEKEVAKGIKIQAIQEEMKESQLINDVLKEYLCFMNNETKSCFSEKKK